MPSLQELGPWLFEIMHGVGMENSQGNCGDVTPSLEAKKRRSGLDERTVVALASTHLKSERPAHALFLDSDDDDDGESAFEALVAQRSALHQRARALLPTSQHQFEDSSIHAELFAPPMKSPEIGRMPFSPDAAYREQAQLHRLLGDYILTAKGDHIMDQMEEALRDKQCSDHKTDGCADQQPAHHQASDDDGFDLSAMLETMQEFDQYIDEN